jgi:hypothetical protein
MARPKTSRAPAGTPTELNLFTLDKEMRRAHGEGLGPLHEFEQTSMAGMRRLLKAGYLAPALGKPQGYWELTGQGVLALEGYREREAALKARWARPGSARGRGDVAYYYHVTLEDFLPSIAANGLQPRSEVKDRSGRYMATYLEPEEENAAVYHHPPETVMLRVQIPGWGKLVSNDDDEFLHDKTIPPDRIDVRRKAGWVPLLSLVPGSPANPPGSARGGVSAARRPKARSAGIAKHMVAYGGVQVGDVIRFIKPSGFVSPHHVVRSLQGKDVITDMDALQVPINKIVFIERFSGPKTARTVESFDLSKPSPLGGGSYDLQGEFTHEPPRALRKRSKRSPKKPWWRFWS